MNVRRLLILGVLVLWGACGSDGGPVSHSNTSEHAGAASGGEVDHVDVRGRPFVVSCAQPSVAGLGDVLKLDAPDNRFDEVTEVRGEPAVVALHAAGRVERCGAVEWVLAFDFPHADSEETAAEQARLTCLVPAVSDDARCSEGGPFWYSTDTTEDGTGGDGRTATWVRGVAPESAWRADPLEVVAREVAWAEEVPPFYRLRRVGLRIVSRSDNRVLIDAVHQDVTPNGDSGTWGSHQREQYEVTRLEGRSGWYDKGYIVATYAQENLSLDELDAAWPADVDRVVIDVDRR